jgi:hypothetical protein
MSRNAQLNHASICRAPRRWPCIDESAVYIVELALRMSPVPVSVQRKEADDAEALYQQIRQAIEQSQPRLLELTCEKVEGKKVTVLIGEVLAVQLYEKASATGGSKRPGFSVDS